MDTTLLVIGSAVLTTRVWAFACSRLDRREQEQCIAGSNVDIFISSESGRRHTKRRVTHKRPASTPSIARGDGASWKRDVT